jgi:hypothetical protein
MTLSRISATGRGRIAARLVIEGLEIEFVSGGRRMEKTTSDGRIRVRGLQLDDVVIGASADLMRATLEAQSLTIKVANMDRIAGSRHGRPTQYLTRTPSIKLFLASDIDTSDTTIALRSTVGLDSGGGVVHIGTEAIEYTAISGSDLTGCTRGHWQTLAQAHFARDGEGLGDAQVTDRPRAIEGRRAYLYLYGDGDDPQGDGTLRWKGIVATEASWSAGVVSFQLDPLTRLLAQPIGGDLGSAIGPRGIKYTNSAPFKITVIQYPTGAEEKRGIFKIDGFYETQEDFVTTVNAGLTQALSSASISLGTGAILQAYARRDSIDIVYVTATSSPVNIGVFIADGYINVLERRSSLAGETSPFDWYRDDGERETRMGDRSWSPPVTTRYFFTIPAPVPRGTIGKFAAWIPYHVPSDTGFESLENLLPLGGLVAPTTSSVLVPQGDEWGEDPRPLRIYSVSGRNVYLLSDRNIRPYNIRTSFELGRSIATGSVVDLLTALILDSPDTCNAGAMPLIDGNDIIPTTDVDAAVIAEPLAHGRGFFAFDGESTLGDFVVPELLAIGAYQRLGLTGSIEWDRLRPPLATDPVTWTITGEKDAALERAPFGTLAQVRYLMGYDPRTGEWEKRTITYRDVQTTSATRTPITLEIAQRSTSTGFYAPGDDWNTIDRDALRRTAMAAFGFFGSPVVVCVVTLDARFMDARIGDSVSMSSALLPDPADGYSQIASRPGMIISHALELSSGRVTLGVVMHTETFVAYNLGILIASQTNVSGNTWTINLTLAGYLYAPDGGANIATHLRVGDLVRVTRADTTSTVEVLGTVTSITDADTVVVNFATTWTPSTNEWFLRARDSLSYNRGQSFARYAHVADSGHRLEFADVADVPGWVFA